MWGTQYLKLMMIGGKEYNQSTLKLLVRLTNSHEYIVAKETPIVTDWFMVSIWFNQAKWSH